MTRINFSIICNAYNNPQETKEFLWSVGNQNYNGTFETIVVDNGTPTLNVCTAICGQPSKIKLRYYRIEPDNRFTDDINIATNMAVQKAKGHYMVIMNHLRYTLYNNALTKISHAIKPHKYIQFPQTENIVLSRMNFYKFKQYPPKENYKKYLETLSKNLIQVVFSKPLVYIK